MTGREMLIIGSFLTFLVAFTVIGALASRVKKNSSEDYLVADRNVNPWLVALSAVSTNNSGYMFIGLIGFTWREGFVAIWITVGWILGDLLTWFWVHRRVRVQSEEVSATSVPSLLATGPGGTFSRPIAVVAGLITLLFLSGYAAAQLKAGSTTLHALFDWPLWAGSALGVLIVVIYCFSGGIRASIWTDAAQSVVMMGSMGLLLAYCVIEVGGMESLAAALAEIDPSLTNWFPENLALGFGLYFLGFVFGGMATVGQPHILVRFMAIDSAQSIRKSGVIYFTWYTLFSLAAFAVGLYARALLPSLTEGLTGAELTAATEGALPELSIELLPPVLVGVMLAGLFSATISTADSQILSCSAAVTQDLSPRWSRSYGAAKVATIVVALFALTLALTASEGVFSLVLMAWSALGATLGPILMVRVLRLPLPTSTALVMIAVGLATVALWGQTPWGDAVFKALPGVLFPLVMYGGWWLLRRPTRADQT